MSGGALFHYTYPDFADADGWWQDEEMNELYHDLFVGGEFSVCGYDGLMQSLDFAVSDDTGMDSYFEKLGKFKAKWFHRTPSNRVKYYQQKIQDYSDKCKAELGVADYTADIIEKYEKRK